MKIFQRHDNGLDVCRAFLVVSMIVTHVFEMYYLPDYNRRLTYFVTIDFVFLSGFTIGALYAENVKQFQEKYFMKMMKRMVKLILLFLFCNAILFQFYSDRMNDFLNMKPFEIIISIVLGLHQAMYGLDILIPIAFTSFFSFFVLLTLRKGLNWPVITSTFIILYVVEYTENVNYYGLVLLLTGICGCLLGKLANELDWEKFVQKMKSNFLIIIVALFLIIYYSIILLYTQKSTKIHIGYHTIPSILILFFVYLSSYKFKLSCNKFIMQNSSLFSEFTLFVYLFHILLINILYLFFAINSMTFLECTGLSVLVTFISGCSCYFIRYFKSKTIFFAKVYNLIFKL